MNFILDNPRAYLIVLIFLWFISNNRLIDMKNEEKNIFFNILCKTQYETIPMKYL